MLYRDHLADLDELVLCCRDQQTKAFFIEAVNCYRAGAYRSAIVATWITVVFDLIAKLREIAFTDDPNTADRGAAALLRDLEDICQKQDVGKSQEFESTVLEKVKTQFELISPLEYEDLQRLHKDRHRCAHPSMHSLEEPFQPTAELARHYLRYAATSVFQHPPVQGKAAKEHVFREIKSAYFPTEVQAALKWLKQGPLLSARPALVREVVGGLTRSLLIEHLPSAERERQLAALQAVLQMYPLEGEQALQTGMSKTLPRVPDADWPYVIQIVRYTPGGWRALSDLGADKTLRFLKSCSLEEESAFITIQDALHILSLRELACSRLPEFPLEVLAQQFSTDPSSDYIEEAIRRFAVSENFEEAKKVTNMLLFPMLSHLTIAQIIKAIEAFKGNSQTFECFRAGDFMQELFARSEPLQTETKHAWISLYSDFCVFYSSLSPHIKRLLTSIEARYPETKAISEAIALEHKKQYDDF